MVYICCLLSSCISLSLCLDTVGQMSGRGPLPPITISQVIPEIDRGVKEKKAPILWTHITERWKLFGEREDISTTLGHRRRGRPRIRWEDNITKWTGLMGDCMLRSAEDRRHWSRIIHEAANPQSEDG